MVVEICAQHHHRVRYGVLGAAIIRRVDNIAARSRDYGRAIGTIMNTSFEVGPLASWVVGVNGFPTNPDFGDFPNPNYDSAWSVHTPLHNDVQVFLDWLDATAPGWHTHLQSTYP